MGADAFLSFEVLKGIGLRASVWLQSIEAAKIRDMTTADHDVAACDQTVSVSPISGGSTPRTCVQRSWRGYAVLVGLDDLLLAGAFRPRELAARQRYDDALSKASTNVEFVATEICPGFPSRT
jgi:hypothetical protein